MSDIAEDDIDQLVYRQAATDKDVNVHQLKTDCLEMAMEARPFGITIEERAIVNGLKYDGPTDELEEFQAAPTRFPKFNRFANLTRRFSTNSLDTLIEGNELDTNYFEDSCSRSDNDEPHSYVPAFYSKSENVQPVHQRLIETLLEREKQGIKSYNQFIKVLQSGELDTDETILDVLASPNKKYAHWLKFYREQKQRQRTHTKVSDWLRAIKDRKIQDQESQHHESTLNYYKDLGKITRNIRKLETGNLKIEKSGKYNSKSHRKNCIFQQSGPYIPTIDDIDNHLGRLNLKSYEVLKK
ncbi:hypothetical protein DFJ63DRAFT_318149 [Scheffersomyces coipomensis]|uniref:uncharacterized protein n=1 Tax=Scheffersomyces coipomensis TaxID=1788519 RepID=UPI00315CE023